MKDTCVPLRAKDLPNEAKIKNDMIRRVKIRRDRGFILGLTVEFASGRQPFFNGYNNTCNIGHMVLELAELLGVNEEGECDDILASFKSTPCRVASNYGGGIIAETTGLTSAVSVTSGSRVQTYITIGCRRKQKAR